MKQLKVMFSGHVQGVGFRYTVVYLSKSFDVVGFVANTIEGKVELVAEGSKNELDEFLKKILQSPLRGHIRKYDYVFTDAANIFTEFKVKF